MQGRRSPHSSNNLVLGIEAWRAIANEPQKGLAIMHFDNRFFSIEENNVIKVIKELNGGRKGMAETQFENMKNCSMG